MAEVDRQFKLMFTAAVEMAPQQNVAMIAPLFDQRPISGEGTSFDSYAATDQMSEQTTRAQEITPKETARDRRWIIPKTYVFAEWFDETDKDKLMAAATPDSELIANWTAQTERLMDLIVWNAATGNAIRGKTPGADTPTTYASTQTTYGQTTAAISTARVIKARRLNRGAGIMDPLIFVSHTYTEHQLMTLAEFVNWDFTTHRPLQNGTLQGFLGMTFGFSPAVPVVPATSIYDALVTTRKHVKWGAKRFSTSVDVIPTRSNATLAQTKLWMGGVRMYDTLVSITNHADPAV